jgi:protein TonB
MRLVLLVFAGVVCHSQDVQDATALLRRVADSARAARSWRTEGTVTSGMDEQKAVVHAFKWAWREPGFGRAEDRFRSRTDLTICDGTSIWRRAMPDNFYNKTDLSAMHDRGTVSRESLEYLSRCPDARPDWEDLLNGLVSARFAGHDELTINGRPRACDNIRAEYRLGDSPPELIRTLCVDRDHLFILREEKELATHATAGSPGLHMETRIFRVIERDTDLDSHLFVFEPPPGPTQTIWMDDPNTKERIPLGWQAPPGITGGSSPPVPIVRPDPEYTERALRAGLHGTVVLSVEIGVDGRARDIRVVHSLDPDLDQKAMECVAKWKFRPARKDGQPVAARSNMGVTFRLPQ